ncbi:MAG TPA: EamA family transporter [Tepidisphaeraceae bacterium]|jgi:transporter family protein
MFEQRWLIYALLSAAAASLIPILGKIGMKGVDSNLATGIRSIAQMLFVVIVCTAMGLWSKLPSLNGKAWTMTALAGIAGGASWLFYFAALQVGKASQVAPIDKMSVPFAVVLALLILGERPSTWNWFGVMLIAIGAYFAALPNPTAGH